MNNTVEKKKGGKILDVIETVGNKLPHPYIMFLWLCLILAGISTCLLYTSPSPRDTR